MAIVLATASVAVAFQVWPQFTTPQSNPAIPINAPGRIVFSVRNTTSGSASISNFAKSTSAICIPMSMPKLVGNPTAIPPYSLAPNQVLQFMVETTGFSTVGDKSCSYAMTATPSGESGTINVQFHVLQTADVDVQPTSMNFGTQPKVSSETQTLVITGWQPTPMDVTVEITSGVGNFLLSGCTGTSESCTVTVPGNGNFGTALVKCAPLGGIGNGQLSVYSGSTVYASVALECNQAIGGSLMIMPSSLFMSAMPGGTDMDTVDVTGTGSLTGASITGGNGTISIQSCGQSCSLVSPLATQLTLVCSPTTVTETATLTVTGTDGTATATIDCAPFIGPGVLYVDTTPINFPDTLVGAESIRTLDVENHGGSALDVDIALAGTQASEFEVRGCAGGCSIGAGSGVQLNLFFRPTTHGPKTSQLQVSATGLGGMAQAESINLSGTGVGGIMVVTQPDAADTYLLDLGTIPRGQTGSADIMVRNDGNLAFLASIDGPQPPYTLTPSSDDVSAGTSTMFRAECGSSTPSAANPQTWTISSAPSAYIGSSQQITVACSIADTELQVDPLAFDFGEVRTGTPAQDRTLTITNPTTSGVDVSSIALQAPRAGLSLSTQPLPTTVAPSTSTTATLRLETGSDSDLTGEFVDIALANATLSLPVRGKVVTARSRIAPARLDLGTACVGSSITGMVRLINEGTATLAVDRPQMSDDAQFLAATPGVMYPAELPPGMQLTAQVAPTMTASGSASGVLAWRDDVPSAFQVPISLEYITSGTAVSPRGLDFGAIKVAETSAPQVLNLENCDAEQRTVTVKSLRGIKGPIGAWMLEPRLGYVKQLASREKQAVIVSFRPPGRGHYEAELVVETELGESRILLAGDAIGRDFETDSFYSCECNAPGAPWGAWPLAFVVIVISVRRRRAAS